MAKYNNMISLPQWVYCFYLLISPSFLINLVQPVQKTEKDANPTTQVTYIEVSDSGDGQRLDNFLVSRLKGVPRTHIYRIIRSGEVRVNSGRCKPSTRLSLDDRIRIPPIRLAQPNTQRIPNSLMGLDKHVLYQDDDVLVLNKPAGLAVHGGSGIKLGIIEALKMDLYRDQYLELAHRLDRETSGCLLLARSRINLLSIHRQFRRDVSGLSKIYQAIVFGHPKQSCFEVNTPLKRIRDAEGQSRVLAVEDGQSAKTRFKVLKQNETMSLVEMQLETGRMHQARAHCAHAGIPILGDSRYGNYQLNRTLSGINKNQLHLHAARLAFSHPSSGRRIEVNAPQPEHMGNLLQSGTHAIKR
ncbi:MAG: 23S rRNA pseudouridine955/2504/2580 synthase [Parasphingorhabdus sp.]|jgi:23S rRNA pseudouridine955/2504/2580 synthase